MCQGLSPWCPLGTESSQHLVQIGIHVYKPETDTSSSILKVPRLHQAIQACWVLCEQGPVISPCPKSSFTVATAFPVPDTSRTSSLHLPSLTPTTPTLHGVTLTNAGSPAQPSLTTSLDSRCPGVGAEFHFSCRSHHGRILVL